MLDILYTIYIIVSNIIKNINNNIYKIKQIKGVQNGINTRTITIND